MLCPAEGQSPLRVSNGCAAAPVPDMAADRDLRFRLPRSTASPVLPPAIASARSDSPALPSVIAGSHATPGPPDTGASPWDTVRGGVQLWCGRCMASLVPCACSACGDTATLPDFLAAFTLADSVITTLWERLRSGAVAVGASFGPPSSRRRHGMTLDCWAARAAPTPLVCVGSASRTPTHRGDSSMDCVSGMTRRWRAPSASSGPELYSWFVPCDRGARRRCSCDGRICACWARFGDSSRCASCAAWSGLTLPGQCQGPPGGCKLGRAGDWWGACDIERPPAVCCCDGIRTALGDLGPGENEGSIPNDCCSDLQQQTGFSEI